MRLWKLGVCVGMFSILTAGSVLADESYKVGEWKSDEKGWWFVENDGRIPKSEWGLIGENWYYFHTDGYMASNTWIGDYYLGSNGIMLRNTVTPDGFRVGEDGKWDRQSRTLSFSDFVVSGNNSITEKVEDRNVLTKINLDSQKYTDGELYGSSLSEVFVKGVDDLTTARGITFGNTLADVLKQYGEASKQNFVADEDFFYTWYRDAGESKVAEVLVHSAAFVEYSDGVNTIRFYFDRENTLIGVAYSIFFGGYDIHSNPRNVVLNEGYYTVKTKEIFDLNGNLIGKSEDGVETGGSDAGKYLRRSFPFPMDIKESTGDKFKIMQDNGDIVSMSFNAERWQIRKIKDPDAIVSEFSTEIVDENTIRSTLVYPKNTSAGLSEYKEVLTYKRVN